MTYSFGAIARGDTSATIEHQGTPAFESIKATFARVTSIDAAAASAVGAAAPSMIADSVAVVLVAGAAWFEQPARPAEAGFRNDALDTELLAALDRAGPAAVIAVAARRAVTR